MGGMGLLPHPNYGKITYDPPVDTKLELGLHALKATFVPSVEESDNFDVKNGNFVATTEILVVPVRGGKRG